MTYSAILEGSDAKWRWEEFKRNLGSIEILSEEVRSNCNLFLTPIQNPETFQITYPDYSDRWQFTLVTKDTKCQTKKS
jgi:hypothetical protein